MLYDRGYALIDGELEMSFEEFQIKTCGNCDKNELTIIASNPENPKELIVVFFVEIDGKSKVSKKMILNYYEKMKGQGISRSIIVTPVKLSTQAEISLSSLQEDTKGSITMETFQESELIVNITNHVIVPKHRLLTKQEKQKLLDLYKIKEAQLPRIQIKDPIARYLGVTKGEVVGITRSSETAGRYVTYRVCL
jgi:DNA-directed RNA polymerase I, II, and III subunit RPABC1